MVYGLSLRIEPGHRADHLAFNHVIPLPFDAHSAAEVAAARGVRTPLSRFALPPGPAPRRVPGNARRDCRAPGSGQPDQSIGDGAGVPRGTPILFPGLVDHQDRGKTDLEFVRYLPQHALVIDLILMQLSRH